MRKFFITCIFLMMILPAASRISHAEISMTIEGTGTFVDFLLMNPGESKELYGRQGDYETQITCSSTNNRTWYLKTWLMMPLRSGPNVIPNQNLKWMVTSVINGQGIVNNINQFNEYTDRPNLIYTSMPADETGNRVQIRLRYGIDMPKNQIAGTYNCIIRFIMMETL